MGTRPGYVVILLFLGKALHVALAKADGGRCERRPEKGGRKDKGRMEIASDPILTRNPLMLVQGRLSLIYIWHTSSVAPCSMGIHCLSRCSARSPREFCWNLGLLDTQQQKPLEYEQHFFAPRPHAQPQTGRNPKKSASKTTPKAAAPGAVAGN